MTNSKNIKRATAIVEQIFELTDEKCLQIKIDRPIEKVLEAFEHDINARITHRYFMDTVSDFVRRIYLSGTGIRQNLSRTQANAEALFVIEKAFGSPQVGGFEAAIVEAFGDFESVLNRLAGFIISWNREKHIRWVYATYLDPSDWRIKCLIAEILIEMWGAFLPPSILSCSPTQFAESLPHLFNALRSTESLVRKTMGTDLEF
jgi:hypothetical protein